MAISDPDTTSSYFGTVYLFCKTTCGDGIRGNIEDIQGTCRNVAGLDSRRFGRRHILHGDTHPFSNSTPEWATNVQEPAMTLPLLLTLFLSLLACRHASAQAPPAAPAQPAPAQPATGSRLACQLLLKQSPHLLVSSSGPLYNEGATSAWNLLNANLRPDCIVFPLTTQDVSAAMKLIFKSKANYAVQAGGHSAMEGWNK